MEKTKIINIEAKPFLRWAGGKKWLIKHLDSLVPIKFKNYHEIFLGSGSVFFNLNKKNFRDAYLSDLNEDLINGYIQIRDNYNDLIKILKTFKNTENFYYQIRENNFDPDPIFRAARMLYLNKAGFNGIYRVNSKGKFNVPFGHRKNIDIVEEANLFLVSKRLERTNISSCDFEIAVENIKKGDLVFIDPPYTVAHENNGFIEYNKKLFSLDDQIKLANCINKIIEKEAFYILTNAKHDKILEIYRTLGRPKIYKRHSHVGGIGAIREEVKEYIFTNCV